MFQLFCLIQRNTQYVGKLNRYFNQVMGDFWTHQTIQLFKFLSPFPSSTQMDDIGSS